jgi:hypothetical protein
MPRWNTKGSPKRKKHEANATAKRREKEDDKWVAEWVQLRNRISALREEEDLLDYRIFDCDDAYFAEDRRRYHDLTMLIPKLEGIRLDMELASNVVYYYLKNWDMNWGK